MIIVVFLTFGLVLVLILGIYWAFVIRPEGQTQEALRKRMKPEDSVRKSRLTIPKSETEHPRVLRPLYELLAQSGLRMTIGGFLLATWCAGFVAFVSVWTIAREPLLGLAGGILFGVLPYVYVRRAASKRIWKFEEQFPEAIDLIARALRAGHAFPTGLAMVADEIPDPVGGEFKLMYDRQNYGLALPDTLRNFAQRVPVLDARFFVTAVLTQREAGGNLAGVLDNLSSVIRERFKVKRQVRAVSAHGRMTAWILSLFPPVLAGIIFTIAPGNMLMLIRDPLGVRMVAGAIILQLIGMYIMRRIVNVEY